MNYPLRIPDQLKPHLRGLRKRRGLTQAQLGALVGVKQARIAEIEANPGAVSLDQLVRVLAALGGTLFLHAEEEAAAAAADRPVPANPSRRAKAAAAPTKAVASPARSLRVGKPPTAPTKPKRKASAADALHVGVVIPAKKGIW